jgi:hypothetical protein
MVRQINEPRRQRRVDVHLRLPASYDAAPRRGRDQAAGQELEEADPRNPRTGSGGRPSVCRAEILWNACVNQITTAFYCRNAQGLIWPAGLNFANANN